MRPIRLTQQVQDPICQAIRAGCYPHVAAEAIGIPVELFREWLRRGHPDRRLTTKKDRACRRLYRAVKQAEAQARIRAEVGTHRKSPFAWLRCGPGREITKPSGWTTPVQAQPRSNKTDRHPNPPFNPEVIEIMLKALEPFPAARIALAEALVKIDQKTQEKPRKRSRKS